MRFLKMIPITLVLIGCSSGFNSVSSSASRDDAETFPGITPLPAPVPAPTPAPTPTPAPVSTPTPSPVTSAPSILDQLIPATSKAQYYALRSAVNGQFVSLQANGTLQATGYHPTANALFLITRLSGDAFTLKSKNGLAVALDNDASLSASQLFGAATVFVAYDAGAGVISIRASTINKYVTAANAGASPLVANQDSVGTAEQFKLMPVIDMNQVLTAFADRHSGQAKQRSYRDQHSGVDWFHNALIVDHRSVPTAQFGRPGIWNQMAVTQIGDSDHPAYTISDWYYLNDDFVGFHGTFPDDPNSWLIWSPLVNVADHYVTPDMDGWYFAGAYDAASGIQAIPGPGDCEFSDIAHSAGQGCFKNVIHFSTMNTQGSIGTRWVITSGADSSQNGDMPLETWTYDLGPSAGIYDPEFGAIGYQQQRPFHDSNSWTVERYGTVIDYTSRPTCYDHYFCF